MMKERILEFLKAENKTSAQFAEEIGVQPSGISHILSGRNNPSLDFILKMLEKYKFLSTEWLLFGKGKMYREPYLQDLFEESVNQPDKPVTSGKTIKLASDEAEKLHVRDGSDMKGRSGVEKIVWFYSDNTFREYFPGNDQDKK